MVIVFLRELAWWKAASIWTMSVALILTIVTAHSISIYPPRRWQATIHVKYPPFRMKGQLRKGWPFMVSRQQIGTTKGFSFHTILTIRIDQLLGKILSKKYSDTSTGCPNKLGIRSKLHASEASIVCKKNVLCSKKLLFQPFLWTARNDNGFLSNFSPISNNLLYKLLHRIIGEKLPKNSSLIFAVHKKGSKSNFMEQNKFFP